MRRQCEFDFSVSNALLELRIKCTSFYHKPLGSSAVRNKHMPKIGALSPWLGATQEDVLVCDVIEQ